MDEFWDDLGKKTWMLIMIRVHTKNQQKWYLLPPAGCFDGWCTNGCLFWASANWSDGNRCFPGLANGFEFLVCLALRTDVFGFIWWISISAFSLKKLAVWTSLEGMNHNKKIAILFKEAHGIKVWDMVSKCGTCDMVSKCWRV